MGGEEGAVEEGQADAGADIDLLEDEDEAIGDRIMEVGPHCASPLENLRIDVGCYKKANIIMLNTLFGSPIPQTT